QTVYFLRRKGEEGEGEEKKEEEKKNENEEEEEEEEAGGGVWIRRTHQSPIDIIDHQAHVGAEYQEIRLVGFDNESSNKTWMKNTGKTVAILLKDDYFISGAGLPGRFKAEKVEFHWGQSNGSAGSEHSINGRRFPVE
ncbi:Receptor-type tyrosine-protein phosphatase gamma, partial [Ophiophagus hannah]